MDQIVKKSELALKFQELLDTGVVTLPAIPLQSDFPSARIVVPVYDADGTGAPLSNGSSGGNDWQTGTRSWRS